eukprot:CAMPEP_0174828614 /NCGR_PEP_ID=MMETSP1114-20130205/1435_1 /TAXON_ID=312471 /ORGANISM="Neobodo designis, Strain CCAP 1951/1" /LENGTH=270 /DNA_ID=CAMNT_0016062335 /DNA_START=73 /DNA_END=881 /DNA_ORIENTATION=-
MDFSLYRIAKQLRLLGYDAECSRENTQEMVVRKARADGRTLITASPSQVPHIEKLNKAVREEAPPPQRTIIGYNSDGESEYADSEPDTDGPGGVINYIVINTNVKFDDQFRQVVQLGGIRWMPHRVFSRCVLCNILISDVPDKESIRDLVSPAVFDAYAHFYQCHGCLKVYWGMDSGVVVNFKALRTIENLKRFCIPASSDVSRHLLSLPRTIKVAIFSFLTVEELRTVGRAYTMLSGLLTAIERGEATKFVPDWKKAKMEERRAARLKA